MAILLWLINRNCGSTAHVGDQFGVALGVGIVQRRIHLIEQAERCRVELKNGKHQGNRGQRLLSAREQVDGFGSSFLAAGP